MVESHVLAVRGEMLYCLSAIVVPSSHDAGSPEQSWNRVSSYDRSPCRLDRNQENGLELG